MQTYIVSAILSLVLICLVFLLMRQLKIATNLPVKIIIDAENKPGAAEKAAMAARLAADRYFDNAEIFILNVPESEQTLIHTAYGIKSL